MVDVVKALCLKKVLHIWMEYINIHTPFKMDILFFYYISPKISSIKGTFSKTLT